MSQEIDLLASCDVLALGEPTHREPAFAHIRNELFAALAGRGFRSIVLETDRVAALTVNDFVQHGIGTLDDAMSQGFSHGFGELDANRELVAWMRDHNRTHPDDEPLAFHGFDAATETMNAPSPRRYLEHARDYLRLDLDIAALTGPDEKWDRTEVVLDATKAPGATPGADHLRVLADDMLTELHARAPELIAKTSRAEWHRAETHLTAGLGLLRYHRQLAQPLDDQSRYTRMTATRDALMAQNLLAIRAVEARRGPTLVFAHNLHLRRNPGTMAMGDEQVTWYGAGAIAESLADDRYTVVVGSLGRSTAIDLDDPDPETYEGGLQGSATWSLTRAARIRPARKRTDTTRWQGYFPLDEELLDGADLVLHVPGQ
jgi:erythromycin esterase-like protein